jgi:hypothetical protein
MECKVSDFQLAQAILKNVCHYRGIPFVDVYISFDSDPSGVSLLIGPTENVAHTIYRIIYEYIKHAVSIVGEELFDTLEEEDNFLITLAAKLRSFIYQMGSFYTKISEPTKQNLYSKPLIWNLMKDIICPINGISIKNINIYLLDKNDIDIARYDSTPEDHILLNDIDNHIVQNVFLFIETIKAHNLSPIETMKEIYESDLYEKYYGLLEITLSDEELNDFEMLLVNILGIELLCSIPKKTDDKVRNHKIAQNLYPNFGTPFWIWGLTERMLEPTRGADWSTYKDLQPYVEEFWNKVEEIKKKRIKSGRDPGVPFNTLLRLKHTQLNDPGPDPTKTIQGLLSSVRIW